MLRPDVLAGMTVACLVGLAALAFISHHIHARSLRVFALYCASLGLLAILGDLTA